jgi:hypothetical protein
VNLSMAITATGLPALALFIAGLYRLPGSGHARPASYPMSTAPHRTASTSRVRYGDAPALPQPLILNHTNTEDSEARKAAAAAQDALNSLRHQLAQAYGSARVA